MAKENSKSTWVSFSSGVIGVVIGALLHYWFTLNTEKSKLWSELRTTAYGQFVDNNAKVSSLIKQSDPDRAKFAEADALRNSGRYLIGLYGTSRVVRAMGEYLRVEREGPKSEKFRNATTELFAAMRQDILPQQEHVSAELLQVVLFTQEFGK